MHKILDRARTLELQVISGLRFPGTIDLDPLEVPIFKLTIINALKLGPLVVRFNNKNADFVIDHQSITIDFQKCALYEQGTAVLPAGTIISIRNLNANLGYVFVKAYTYYWEV